jgi:hypothetical protein
VINPAADLIVGEAPASLRSQVSQG